MPPTRAEVESFERVQSQLTKLYQEMSILSKSKPDNPINKFKLKFINERVQQANKILAGNYQPFADFEVFDENSLPSNSDVVLIFSQYLDSLNDWKSDNIPPDFDLLWGT